MCFQSFRNCPRRFASSKLILNFTRPHAITYTNCKQYICNAIPSLSSGLETLCSGFIYKYTLTCWQYNELEFFKTVLGLSCQNFSLTSAEGETVTSETIVCYYRRHRVYIIQRCNCCTHFFVRMLGKLLDACIWLDDD